MSVIGQHNKLGTKWCFLDHVLKSKNGCSLRMLGYYVWGAEVVSSADFTAGTLSW